MTFGHEINDLLTKVAPGSSRPGWCLARPGPVPGAARPGPRPSNSRAWARTRVRADMGMPPPPSQVRQGCHNFLRYTMLLVLLHCNLLIIYLSISIYRERYMHICTHTYTCNLLKLCGDGTSTFLSEMGIWHLHLPG